MLQPGYQAMQIRQRMRLVSCAESGCPWYMLGHEGIDAAGRTYRHPVGAPCGDVVACPDPECPCTARCADTTDRRILARYRYIADGGIGYVVGHHYAPVADPGQAISYYVDRGAGLYQTVEDEVLQRTAQGIEALQFIKERGL